MCVKKSIKRLLVPVCIIALYLTILPFFSAVSANANTTKKLTVKVKFKGTSTTKWGTKEERAKFIKDLKAQLESEWGKDVKVKRGGKEETIKGLDIEVSEGDAGSGELAVIVHDKNDGGSGDLGSYSYGKTECHVYPKNMKDTGWSKNLGLWLEKTAAHEIGHYACANDHNEAGVPDKMAQSWKVKEYADKQKKKFDEVNKNRKFSDDLRQKQMKNINKGGAQCKTDSDFFDTPGYGNSTLVLDDPTVEESGIVNFAITASGTRAGDFDLGFINPGIDKLPGTSDDYIITKWLGDKEMDFDWTPYDNIDDWERFGPEPLDYVVSLFDTAWYSWAAIDISNDSSFLLQDYGELTLMDPDYNSIWDTTVYNTAILDFDFDNDDIFDTSFYLSSDLSNLVEDTELLYELNKPGTGFTTSPVPEPAIILLFGSGLIGLVGFSKKFGKG